MQRKIRVGAVALILAAVTAVAAPAQEGYTFTASIAGGLAGAFDTDGARDYDRPALQAAFGMFTNDRTLTVVRLGRVDLDSGASFAGLDNAKMEYANVAGEYRFRQAAYDFGVYVGVGGYRLRDDGPAGGGDETALGAALGFTGDFDVTRRISFVAEIDFHYVFFDDVNFYGAALAGVAVHF